MVKEIELPKQKIKIEDLYEQMIDLEFNSIMEDRNRISELVWESAKSMVDSMSHDELLEMAEYHGMDIELEE